MSHVPDVAVAAAAGHNSTRAAASGVRQSTNEVFMVAPTAFGFNDQARAAALGRGEAGPWADRRRGPAQAARARGGCMAQAARGCEAVQRCCTHPVRL